MPELALVEDANCISCSDCNFQMIFDHWNINPGIFGASHSTACVAGSNCDGHPDCAVGVLTDEEIFLERELQRQLEGLAGGLDNAVALLDGAFSERVMLNLDRRAMQVESACGDGRIIAHLPLTGEQVAMAILKDPSLTLTAHAGD